MSRAFRMQRWQTKLLVGLVLLVPALALGEIEDGETLSRSGRHLMEAASSWVPEYVLSASLAELGWPRHGPAMKAAPALPVNCVYSKHLQMQARGWSRRGASGVVAGRAHRRCRQQQWQHPVDLRLWCTTGVRQPAGASERQGQHFPRRGWGPVRIPRAGGWAAKARGAGEGPVMQAQGCSSWCTRAGAGCMPPGVVVGLHAHALHNRCLFPTIAPMPTARS